MDGREVLISLSNPGNSVRALELYVEDECDMLTCRECFADPDRAIEFVCSANEQPDGRCKVVLYTSDPAEVITIGEGPVLSIMYDVNDEDPEAVCCGIVPEDVRAADAFNEELSVCVSSGEVCFFTCGDIAPRDCLGSPFCGDGQVDIFDILEMVDILLGNVDVTECQTVHGDVPNGMPPYCGNPSGEANCQSDGVLTIFDLLVVIDKALGKANCCDYCYFDEIY